MYVCGRGRRGDLAPVNQHATVYERRQHETLESVRKTSYGLVG